MEILIFKTPDYYEAMNFPVTIIIYLLLIFVMYKFFVGYKFFGCMYDDNQITYSNTLLHKSSTINIKDAGEAWFGGKGVEFYKARNGKEQGDVSLFYIPFFRGGIVEAVSLDAFFKQLKGDEQIRVIKDFTVLPGYTKKWKLVTAIYLLLAIIAFCNTVTPIQAMVVLYMNK
jgi:hypothetical protein